ncbi:MAG: hypothetical protein RIC87_15500 [Kiloniellales bacterium]
MRVLAAVIGLLALPAAAMAQDPYSFYEPWSGTNLYQGSSPSYQPYYSEPLSAVTQDGFTMFSDGTSAVTTDGLTMFSNGASCVSGGGLTSCSGATHGGAVGEYIRLMDAWGGTAR